MPVTNSPIDQDRLWADLMALGAITDPDKPWTRRSFTPLFLDGRDWLARRFRDAGLSVRIDAAGNLIGRREGRVPGAKAITIGSHSDSVPSGGRFDGPAGVLAGLEVARALADRGIVLDHAFEVIDFLAEEPSEYGLSCVGSRGMAGALGPNELAMTGPGGETLGAAIARVGGAPERLGEALRDDIAAYLELHIEQGTVLESQKLDGGIVTAIVGITRLEIVFAGEAAHAGTVGMRSRRDASHAAAAAVLAVRDVATALLDRGEGYVVATTGIVTVSPGAANVVPGESRVVVDARAETTALCGLLVAGIESRIRAIAAETGVSVARFAVLSSNDPSTCDPHLRQTLAESAAALGAGTTVMASGAGHDAAFVSRIAPAAMLFIPCRDGRSHCPEEWSEPGEVAAGTAVLFEAVTRLDRTLAAP
ncbi:Zn-dependent hydrolase [Rhodoplanes elegans]|nr:Zn-dependent hydrolase [Rhodoplanes elegans]MBK5958921.1 Zn-dependent hydrolase [Rhodoplanes elegans]